MLKTALVGVISVLLHGCFAGNSYVGIPANDQFHDNHIPAVQQQTQKPIESVRTISDEEAFSKARRTVVSQLKDPYSAVFGELFRTTSRNVRGEPTDVVCGKVNAKNSFGGYTGMKGFVFMVEHESAYLADSGGTLGDLGYTVYRRFCS